MFKNEYLRKIVAHRKQNTKKTLLIKGFKYIFITLASIASALYLLSLLLRLDAVQHRLGEYVADELRSAYGIPLKIGGLRIRHFDEIIIKDILLTEPEGDTIMHSEEGTAHISPLKMYKGEIQINTLAFARPDIRISKATQGAPLNIQFIIDNLSKNKSGNSQNINLRINQFLAYDGRFRYDILDAEEKHEAFDKNHIYIDSLACNISIRKLDKGLADITIRSFSGDEKSGLKLKKIRSKAKLTNDSLEFRDMEIIMPGSHITSNRLTIKPNTASPKKPAISGDIKSGRFSLDDLKPLLGKNGTGIPEMAFNITGDVDSAESRTDVYLRTADNSISLHATANIKSIYESDKRSCSIQIKECSVAENGFYNLQSFMKSGDIALLKRLGSSDISGEAHIENGTINGNGRIACQAGELKARIFFDKKKGFSVISEGNNIKLGRITGIQELESCNIEARINGNTLNWGNTTEIGGSITELTAKGYTYAPIDFTSSLDNNRIKAHITIEDPNLKGTFILSYKPNMNDRVDIDLRVDSIAPGKLNLTNSPDNTISFTLDGEYNNYGNGNSRMNAKIQNLIVDNGEKRNEVRNIHIHDDRSEEQHILLFNSDILDCNIIGEFEYSTLLKGVHDIFAGHFINRSKESNRIVPGNNSYTFRLGIRNSGILNEIFHLPASINEYSTIKGECSEKDGIFRINADINNASITNGIYRSIKLDGYTDNNEITLAVEAVKPIIRNKKDFNYSNTDNDLVIKLNSLYSNDSITSKVKWENGNTGRKIKGALGVNAEIRQSLEGIPYISAIINPDSIIHNDSLWFVSAGSIKGNLKRIEISDMNLYNKSQSIKIHGTAGKNATDVLHIDARNIEIATIFDLINFNKLEFSGNASGKADVTNALGKPDVKGLFNIEHFRINSCQMGTAEANLGWDSQSKAILIDTNIIGSNGTSTVKGFLSQANDTIELKVDADNLRIGFLNKYLKSFVSDLKGECNGKTYIRGSWRLIDLYGALSLECSTRVKATNTVYTLQSNSVSMSSGNISLNNAQLTDLYGNKGSMAGYVSHDKFSDWACDFNFTTDNMLVYDTHDFNDMPFYGTVFATGTARMTSNTDGLFLSATLENGANSRIIYNSGDVGGVRDNSFITFTDSRKKANSMGKGKEIDKYSFLSRLNLDFMLDINDRMQLKVYTNMQSDDYIDLYGIGPIHAIYDEHEGFSMKGNLNLERGAYKFTIQDIFPKEFSITKGSKLHFNGDPFNAQLDLRTKYLVPSVSLSDLAPEIARRKNVKVNCLMNIGGTLQAPSLTFGIELPEGSEEEKEILASSISTQEQRNMQFIYLIGIGKFYTYDYNTAQTGDSQSSTAMESFISNTLSGQLNNMLGHIIDNNNWEISGNFSTSERGWNSMEVEGMLAGRLLNNRLLINGNFGYRENPIASSNFVGNFEVQWLMTPKGTVSLKAYSKTNDRYFSKTNLTTQGAGIILRHDFNSWNWWRKKKGTKKEEKKKEKKNKKEESKKVAGTTPAKQENEQSLYILK